MFTFTEILALFFLCQFPSCIHSTFPPRFLPVTRSVALPTFRSPKFSAPLVSDFDQDGYPDLLLTFHNYRLPLLYFFSSHKQRFTLHGALPLDYLDVHGVSSFPHPYNRNVTLLAVALGGGNGGNLKAPALFGVDKRRKIWRVSGPKEGGRGRHVVFGDFEGKGVLGMVVVGYLGRRKDLKQRVYEMSRDGWSEKGEWEGEREGKVVLGDVDADGRVELLGVGEGGVYKVGRDGVRDVGEVVWPEPWKMGPWGTDGGANAAVVELDLDNDGLLDLYVARARRWVLTKKTEKENKGALVRDLVFWNRGGSYEEVGQQLGVDLLGDSVHVGVGDFDNDGWMDLYVVQWGERDWVLKNKGGQGLERIKVGERGGKMGGNVKVWDYDGDGKVDVLIGRGEPWGEGGIYAMWRNVGEVGNWVAVSVGRSKTGWGGVGARVEIGVGEGRRVRRVGEEGQVHFGVGNAQQVGFVEVRWTNGDVEILYQIGTNAVVRVGE